jgi:hypothetical protein
MDTQGAIGSYLVYMIKVLVSFLDIRKIWGGGHYRTKLKPQKNPQGGTTVLIKQPILLSSGNQEMIMYVR